MSTTAHRIFPRGFIITSSTTLTGDHTRSPAGFTYAEVVRILYRIKMFRLRVSITGTLDQGTPQAYTCSIDRAWKHGATYTVGGGSTTPATDPITSEIQTVLYRYNSAPDTLRMSAQAGTAQNIFDNVLIWLNFGNTSFSYFKDDLYWPDIFVRHQEVNTGTGSGTSSPGILLGGPSSGAHINNQTGTVFGKSVNVEVFTSLTSGVAVSTFSFVLDADDVGGGYWPYDPGDGGGPIWNTNTGAQLRNPFAL